MEILEDKYIELLFHCILLKKDDILFLNIILLMKKC